MARSSRPPAAAATRISHACALHARAGKLAFAWSARACDLRRVATADGRYDCIVVQRSFAQRC
eukprot:1166600-Lingulodinium_polyedra.AAC.1